jgi:hypothetical protein
LLYQPNQKTDFLMKPDPSALKAALRKREEELQKIIRQMKQDELQTSPVYRSLEEELASLKTQLVEQPGKTS